MLNISLQEAQNKLPELINLVEQGEEIFILGDNETRIKPVSFTGKAKKEYSVNIKDLQPSAKILTILYPIVFG